MVHHHASHIKKTNGQRKHSLLLYVHVLPYCCERRSLLAETILQALSSTRLLPPTRPCCLERCNPQSPNSLMEDHSSLRRRRRRRQLALDAQGLVGNMNSMIKDNCFVGAKDNGRQETLLLLLLLTRSNRLHQLGKRHALSLDHDAPTRSRVVFSL